MNYTFAVITKVPESGQRNTYDAILVKDWDEFNEGDQIYRMAQKEDFIEILDNVDTLNKHINARLPVFNLGEVVILDGPYGREVTGMQRKPSKWSVEVEEFDNLDDAVKKAQEVLKED